ncbi:hypothetical protein AVEN_230883-1 [Araneus ventricosus]|uniref:Uncharacterized protein n=1 Tax=Araneus ventricosus TaxID=182803 RepID=A0A4Y2A3F4_ARAVE|nr:hypothetical protein AVEN_230883-1 [Araneus ventricosus]
MPVGDANRNKTCNPLRVSLVTLFLGVKSVLISSLCASSCQSQRTSQPYVSFLATGQREEITSSGKSMTSEGSVLMESALKRLMSELMGIKPFPN